MNTVGAVSGLLREAIDVYAGNPTALRALQGYARRLEEPLRVAIAGMVKAGKSTLLNAIIGEEIAPTDAGECTRVVTWYRYGDTPRVTLHPLTGEPRALAVKRTAGRLEFNMGQTRAEDVGRLVVDWPARSLRNLTLIDTPGIASLSGEVSARSTEFLTPQDAPSEADAVVYLMRHLHAADLSFLESFRDSAGALSGTVNALAVLSRADEVGAGRIDSLLSAREIARRYRSEDSVRALVLDVVPVAGLLAQSARSLRQAEFAALVEFAQLERDERERMLLSADRFVRRTSQSKVDAEARAALLDRFGLFGIRLSAVLIRSGIADSTALAHELARRSGLDELMRVISGQFQARAAQLKARTAMAGIEAVCREHPGAGSERLVDSLERIQAGAHEFRELRLLSTARTVGLNLPSELTLEVEQVIGGHGIAPSCRLGLAEDASPTELRSQAMSRLHRWRALAENPLTDRATAEVCHIVARSCEAVLAQVQSGSGSPDTARLMLGAEPGTGSRQHADNQGHGSQQQLGR